MKIVGIIPSRYASSRFPGKPLIDLKGKSMIQRVYEGVQKSTLFTRIIVATDDQRIFDKVKSFGGEVMMTSEDHATGTDRCAEVAEKVEADIIVNIQGDEPLVDYHQLDQLCAVFSNKEVLIATLGINGVSEEERNNPNRIKLVRNSIGDAMYFSRSAIPNTVNGQQSVVESYPFYRHIGVYAYRKEVLKELTSLEPTTLEKVESLEQLRWMYHGYSIRVVETKIETPNIDVPEDIQSVLDAL